MWCIINKPKNVGSNSINILCKNILQIKCGYAGTLDRPAFGILPVATGATTKLIPQLMKQTKTYVFTMEFGKQTNTGDYVGNIVKTSDIVPNIADFLGIIPEFIGHTQQAPHPFSVVKINGKRMSDLVRKKIKFQIQKRSIFIQDIKLLEFVGKQATLQVICNSGVYIRSLCEDMAVQLQTVAYVTSLCRTTVGPFDLSHANNLVICDANTLFQHKHFIKATTRDSDIVTYYTLPSNLVWQNEEMVNTQVVII